MPELLIREPDHDSLPRVKLPPQQSGVPVPFVYYPSDDGTDENLLVLLHGLGDTHVPFSKLGRQLKLPQTAILALRAPEQVPFLYEEAYQWYPSFDDLGELIERPNPTSVLELISKIYDHLTDHCKWPANRIHLFGFAQGGSVVAEFGVKIWRKQMQNSLALSLGSIVTISGPMLSYPTISALSPTPLLVVYRLPPSETALPAGSLAAYRKAYQSVTEAKISAQGAGMPSSKVEWEPIMRFWGENLARRQVGGLYEVLSGGT
ncbi:hypothetical protein BD779DRAFT_1507669 [Infundibulicybe gibba]|nr:hypothetical protein BD779DRAFT_1507669 [Infundibulicybe gibba]